MTSAATDRYGTTIDAVEEYDHCFECSLCSQQWPNDSSSALGCGHVFCWDCSFEWAKKAPKTYIEGIAHIKCPNCNAVVPIEQQDIVLFQAAPLDETTALERMRTDAAGVRRDNTKLRREIERIGELVEKVSLHRAELDGVLEDLERAAKIGRRDDEMELDDVDDLDGA